MKVLDYLMKIDFLQLGSLEAPKFLYCLHNGF
jgi:hypothetical protein